MTVYVTTDGAEFDLDAMSQRQRRTAVALIASGHLSPKSPPKKTAPPPTTQKKG